MKILLINKFHYLKGGSETYYFGLADLLRKHGHEVIFFAMKDEKNFPCEQEKYFVENIDFNGKMSKLQIAQAGLKMLYSLEAKKKLEELIRDEKPDIAHINLFQSQLTGSIVDVLYKYHIPMVYTTHDLKVVCPSYLFMCHGQICRECIHGNYLPCIKKHCMKNSLSKSILASVEAEIYRIRKTYDKINLMIAPSDHHKNYLMESGATKTRVIRMRNFLPEQVQLTDDYTAGKYFLYFGRISEEKGILTLIQAYAMSRVESPLYIVGTGPQGDEVKKLISELEIEDKVKVLGYKTGHELVDLVHGSKCVILPSECCENAPYSILEAMAAARPVIVTDNGGLPEIVEEGRNGYVAKAGNPENLAGHLKKMEAMSDEELSMMGKTAQQMVKKMADSEKYVKKIISIYEYLWDIRHE